MRDVFIGTRKEKRKKREESNSDKERQDCDECPQEESQRVVKLSQTNTYVDSDQDYENVWERTQRRKYLLSTEDNVSRGEKDQGKWMEGERDKVESQELQELDNN